LVQEVIGLVDQAEGDIGDHFGRARFHELADVLVSERGLAGHLADVLSLFGVLVPQGQITDAQVVAVIAQQFFEAGAGDIGELDLGFL
jgi:hypothetical protein